MTAETVLGLYHGERRSFINDLCHRLALACNAHPTSDRTFNPSPTGSINDITVRSEDGDEPLNLKAVTNASASIRCSRHSSTEADFDAPSERRHSAPINDSKGGDVIDSTSTTTSSEQQSCYNLRTDKTAIFRPVYPDGPGDALETVLDVSQNQRQRKTEIVLQVK